MEHELRHFKEALAHLGREIKHMNSTLQSLSDQVAKSAASEVSAVAVIQSLQAQIASLNAAAVVDAANAQDKADLAEALKVAADATEKLAVVQAELDAAVAAAHAPVP